MEVLKLYDSHGNIVDEASEFPFGVMQANPPRQPQLGDIVIYVDSVEGDYNFHEPKPALIQYILNNGEVSLHVYEADPCDTHTETATYSEASEPGTWHWKQA